MKIRQIVLLVLLVLILIFVLQNTRVVEVRILFWRVAMSRSLMLIAAFLIGLLGGWILHGFRAASGKKGKAPRVRPPGPPSKQA